MSYRELDTQPDAIKDRAQLLQLVAQDGLALSLGSRELQDDEEVVEKAVRQNGLAVEYASPRLKSKARGSSIPLLAVMQNGLALRFLPEHQNDGWLVDYAVRQNGLALEFASEPLRNSEHIVRMAMYKNPHALQFAGPKIIDYYSFLKPFIEKDVTILRYTSPTVRSIWSKLYPRTLDNVPEIREQITKDLLEAAAIKETERQKPPPDPKDIH